VANLAVRPPRTGPESTVCTHGWTADGSALRCPSGMYVTWPPESAGSARCEASPQRRVTVSVRHVIATAFSAVIEETVKDADAKPERIHRNPRVDAMEHPRKVQVRGKPERREAVPPDAEAAERLEVRAAAQHVRHRLRLRVLR